jgi:hypothetical protein
VLRTLAIASLATVMSVGMAQAATTFLLGSCATAQAARRSPADVLREQPASDRDVRLRSGKNGVP